MLPPTFPVNSILLSSLLASTLLLTSVMADVTVETATKPPVRDVVISLTVPDSGAIGYQWRNTPDNGRRDLGQAFVPTQDFTLSQITVQLQSGSGVGTKDSPFLLTVFELKGKTISHPLATVAGTLPKEISPANTYLSFNLSEENLTLKAGVTYGFLLTFEDQADSRALSLQSLNLNAGQPAIQRLESSDGSKLIISKAALEFYIQATPAK